MLEEHGFFDGAPNDKLSGFIHLSCENQLEDTINKHFSADANITIAAVDIEALGDKIKWEPSRGGQLFPHLYGGLNNDQIIALSPLIRNSDGSVQVPTPQESVPLVNQD